MEEKKIKYKQTKKKDKTNTISLKSFEQKSFGELTFSPSSRFILTELLYLVYIIKGPVA